MRAEQEQTTMPDIDPAAHPTYEDLVTDQSNREMRVASGAVDSADPAVTLLYLLARDHLPIGDVEELLAAVDRAAGISQFTNGWLAEWARYSADRLLAEERVKAEVDSFLAAGIPTRDSRRRAIVRVPEASIRALGYDDPTDIDIDVPLGYSMSGYSMSGGVLVFTVAASVLPVAKPGAEVPELGWRLGEDRRLVILPWSP